MSQDLIRRLGTAVAAAMLSVSVVGMPAARADDKVATPAGAAAADKANAAVKATAAEKPAAGDKPATSANPATTSASRPAAAKEPADVGAVKMAGDQGKNFLARHEGFLQDLKAKDGKVDLLLVGDSITDGFRKSGKDVVAKWAEAWSVYNIGIGGDRTQHVIWRLDHGEVEGISPKVAMLMIGTNNIGGNPAVIQNTDEEIAAGVTRIVRQLNEKLPNTKVLLIGIFPRGEKADNPARARIKAINERIAKLDDDGKHVKYLDIGDKFLDKDGTLPKDVMKDFLHPNEKGYAIWSDAVTPEIKALAAK